MRDLSAIKIKLSHLSSSNSLSIVFTRVVEQTRILNNTNTNENATTTFGRRRRSDDVFVCVARRIDVVYVVYVVGRRREEKKTKTKGTDGFGGWKTTTRALRNGRCF